MGHDTRKVAFMRKLTIGPAFSAIASYCGPMQMACGMTSPTTRTATTEMRMAYVDGTILSKKIGNASRAHALQNNNVTKSQ